MNMNELIKVFRDHLYELQTALDQSPVSNENSMCFTLTEWLHYAIAAYAKSHSNLDQAFLNVIDQAISAIKEGKSPDEFYSSMITNESDASNSPILSVTQGYCLDNGSNWNIVKSALSRGDNIGLNGILARFVNLLNVKSTQISEMLETNSQDSLLQWDATIIAAYCWSKAAIIAYVAKEIELYFQRWHIGSSKDFFPYTMDKANYTNERTKNGRQEIWKEMEPKIVEYEKEYYELIHSDRYIYYNNKFCKVNNQGYSKNTKGGYSTDSDGDYVKLANLDVYLNQIEINEWYLKDGEEYKETFDLQSYMLSSYSNSRGGKACPELMNYVASRLDDNYKVDKQFLTNYALGVDCSGFVSRAIVSVMIKLRVPVRIQLQTIGAGYGRLKSNSTTLRSKGRKTLFSYRNGKFVSGLITTEPTKDFHLIFQPGDIIMKKKILITGDKTKGTYKETLQDDGFHIWIIKEASATQFEVLNSSAINKYGPRSDIHRDLSTFKASKQFEHSQTGKGQTTETFIEFARPNIFSDMTDLSEYYVKVLMNMQEKG